MTFDETMRELKRVGTAQNRKIYKRHGSGDDVFGVSFANLGKLRNRIGVDQQLAEELWETGNADARALATMVADPAAFPSRDLDRWLKDVSYYLLVDLFTKHVVAKTPYARAHADRWAVSLREWFGRAGWTPSPSSRSVTTSWRMPTSRGSWSGSRRRSTRHRTGSATR